MRFVTTLVFVLAICLVGIASAQTPYVSVVFSDGSEEIVCPGPGIDSLFVYAYNFNAFLSGIEYGINYPDGNADGNSPGEPNYMTWIADYDTQPVTIGTSFTGLSMGWPIPVNGFFPVLVHKVLINWTCTGCLATQGEVTVIPHPLFGFVRATKFPDQGIIDGVGLTSLVCATVASEETTWGQIKSLYED